MGSAPAETPEVKEGKTPEDEAPQWEKKPNSFFYFMDTIKYLFVGPVEYVRTNFVEVFQQRYPYYHQIFKRVPTIDQCNIEDSVCYFEANCQYKRDRLVDSEILSILRHRFEDCIMYEKPDHLTNCKEVLATYECAATNWFIKYGDLGGYHNVRTCFMKQKHRLKWEEIHGPVGTGMAEFEDEEEAEAPEAEVKV